MWGLSCATEHACALCHNTRHAGAFSHRSACERSPPYHITWRWTLHSACGQTLPDGKASWQTFPHHGACWVTFPHQSACGQTLPHHRARGQDFAPHRAYHQSLLDLWVRKRNLPHRRRWRQNMRHHASVTGRDNKLCPTIGHMGRFCSLIGRACGVCPSTRHGRSLPCHKDMPRNMLVHFATTQGMREHFPPP